MYYVHLCSILIMCYFDNLDCLLRKKTLLQCPPHHVMYKYSFALKLFSASPSCTSYPSKKKLTIIRVRTYLPWVQYCIQQHNKTTVQLLYPFISTKCALENQTKSPTIEYGYLNFVKKIIRFPVEPLYTYR